jgi:CBS domain containing-hemolysin-like protein
MPTDYLIPILVTIGLIILNGLFVAAEFAIIGVPRTSIERRAARGDKIAGLVHSVLRNPRNQDRYIATAQLGITFASLGLGMYGEHHLAHWLANLFDNFGAAQWIFAHTLASILAVIILTYFHIVLGEMIPKSLALQHAERTAVWVSPPMLWIKYSIYPLVLALNGTGNLILKLVGIDRQRGSSEQLHSPEELRLIVSESLEGGLIQSEAGQVVKELFDFPELTASEVMVPRVRIIGIPMGTSPEGLKEFMSQTPHTRYPVFKENLDNIVGMVHAKDILRLVQSGEALGDPALMPLPYLPETVHLDAVLRALHEAKSQMVVVMDEYGGTAGLITTEDLFEELIGEIDEEPTSDFETANWQDTGLLCVDGTSRLDEVGELLNLAIEHEEVITVSGLILMLLGRPPEVGDQVTYEGLRFKVTAIEGHGVKECLVSVDQRG